MNIKLSMRAALLLVILIVSATIFFVYVGGEYYFVAGDNPLNNLSISAIYHEIFIWENLDYSGALQGVLSPISALLLLFNLFFIKAFGVGFGNALYEYSFYAIGGIGIFLFSYELTKDYGRLPAYLGSFMSAGLFVFEIQSHLGEDEIPAMVLPILFLSLFYLVEKSNKPKYIFWSVISLAITLSLAGEFLVADVLFYIIFCASFLLFSKAGKYQKKLFVAFALILSLAILTIITMPLSLLSYMTTYNASTTSTLSYNYKIFSSTLIGTQSSYFLSTYNINTDNNVLLAVLGICFLVLILLNIKQLIENDHKPKRQCQTNRGFLFALLVSFIFFIFLATVSQNPFGPILSIISRYIPQIRIFTVLHSYSIFLFLFSSLSGSSIAYFTKKFMGNKPLLFPFFILLFALFTAYLYFFAYMPIYGNLGFPITPVGIKNIPGYVVSISNYVNNQYGNFAVGTLPISSDGSWQLDSWYFGENIYSSFVTQHPTYTGGFSFYNNQFYFPVSANLYNLLGSQFDTNMSGYKFSRMFGLLGIKYIIVQGNTLKNATIFSKRSPNFNLSTIYYNLNKSDMTLVKRFNNSSIYENHYYLPLIYTSNVKNLGNASTGVLFKNVSDTSFNITDLALYSTNIDGLYNKSNKINVTAIAKFSKPSTSFFEDNPTKITVHIFNATTPYYIVFRETYNPNWSAFYSNGTEVAQRYHIAVNGFANAWYMNKIGNCTITIYYMEQMPIWISWIISFAALVAVCYIGWLGYKRSTKVMKVSKKEKRGVKPYVQNK